MAKQLINTADLVGRKVWIEKPKKKDPDATKKMGKVRACVFHPQDKRCVGFIVKRPDLALMFHRKDMFVAYNGYDLVDGNIMIHDDDPAATDKGACNALGINWDDCVLWEGLPVMCQDGTMFGQVGSVNYHAETGAIDTLEVTQGATANKLLGVRRVPAGLIRGFRRGMGIELALSSEEEEEGVIRGAILVDDAVKQLPVEGGVAEKAGEATAVVGHKAKMAIESAKPKVSEAAAVAGEAASKGAYLTGRQLKRASGMFSEFKDEFAKASGKTAVEADSKEEPAALEAAETYVEEVVEEVEYTFVDEDGNEILFVDEDGNVITDPDLIAELLEEDGDLVIEAGKPEKPERTEEPDNYASALSEAAKPSVEAAAKAAGSHLKKAGGMFSAFKDEFNKAMKYTDEKSD